MNPAKFAMIASGLIIGVGGYYVVSSMNHEKQRSELNRAQEDLKNSQGALERMKSTLENAELEEARAQKEKQSAASSLNTNTSAVSALEAEKKALTAKLEAMQTEWEATFTGWKAAIDKNRAAAKALAPFSLPMPDGSTLEECVIKEITDTGVNIEHSAGVAKLTGKTLPAAMQTKYLPGWKPAAWPQTAAPAEQPADEPPTAAAETAPSATAATTPAPAPSPGATRRDEIRKQINDLNAKCALAEKNETAARLEYDKHLQKYLATRSTGGVSSSKQYADQALKRANELRGQINAARQQVIQLQLELGQLKP
jgi:hypothetical protein